MEVSRKSREPLVEVSWNSLVSHGSLARISWTCQESFMEFSEESRGNLRRDLREPHKSRMGLNDNLMRVS